MSERLLEYTAAGVGKVDTERGILYGVKVLGIISGNGRKYPVATLKNALPLYEGVGVFIDHDTSGQTRSYASRIGTLKNIKLAEGVRGDLHVNKGHAIAGQLLWDAENNPTAVGFSHCADGRTRRQNGTVIVEEITKVVSVDLVTDPATTKGLFEHTEHLDETGDDTPTVNSGKEFADRLTGKPPADKLKEFAHQVQGGEFEGRYIPWPPQ